MYVCMYVLIAICTAKKGVVDTNHFGEKKKTKMKRNARVRKVRKSIIG